MPEPDLVKANWSAALDAAREALRGVGGNTPLAERHAARGKAAKAAAAVFEKAKAGVKSVRANIKWGVGNPEVTLEVVTMGRQRYDQATIEAGNKPTAAQSTTPDVANDPP